MGAENEGKGGLIPGLCVPLTLKMAANGPSISAGRKGGTRQQALKLKEYFLEVRESATQFIPASSIPPLQTADAGFCHLKPTYFIICM